MRVLHFLASVLLSVLVLQPNAFAQKVGKRAVDEQPSDIPKARQDSSNKPRTFEFAGEEIGDAIRRLAREAKMNVVVSPKVKGAVTLMSENKTPYDVIRIIAQANSLVIEELEGILYIKTADEVRKEFHLSSHTLPIILARFKRDYYQALRKEGFSRDEALKIVAAEQLLKDLPSPTEK